MHVERNETNVTNRNDPAEQMIACLDVLWEEMQWRISVTGDEVVPAPPSEDELITAMWQLPELVFSMAAEMDDLYRLLEQIAQAQRVQQDQYDRVQSIIMPGR